MNIFRKCYNSALVESDLLYDLNKLGFNQLDGTAYDTSGGFYNKMITLHWKKDKNYTIPTTSVKTNCPYPVIYNSGAQGFYLSSPSSVLPDRPDYLFTSISNIDAFLNIIFIPLVNNGFCLLSLLGPEWIKNKPTLPIYSINETYYNDRDDYLRVDCLIGLKTNLTNNPYSYITCYTRTAFGSVYKGPYFWPGDGSTTPLSIPGVDESEHQDTVSYNTNVCTLTKMPYNSTYINGAYLCTTSPFADGVSGKIFSFGGRTFMGIYNNLVLELPSN